MELPSIMTFKADFGWKYPWNEISTLFKECKVTLGCDSEGEVANRQKGRFS
jgi:hypothetical protein